MSAHNGDDHEFAKARARVWVALGIAVMVLGTTLAVAFYLAGDLF